MANANINIYGKLVAKTEEGIVVDGESVGGWDDKQDALTTSSVNDGTVNKAIGFDSNGNIVKGEAGGKVEVIDLR